jgi:hypothetical protein
MLPKFHAPGSGSGSAFPIRSPDPRQSNECGSRGIRFFTNVETVRTAGTLKPTREREMSSVWRKRKKREPGNHLVVDEM